MVGGATADPCVGYYNALFDKLKDSPGEQILIIQGGIVEDGAVELLPIWAADGHANDQADEGQYTLELRSSNGEALYQIIFSIQVGWPGTSAIFRRIAASTPQKSRLWTSPYTRKMLLSQLVGPGVIRTMMI